MSKPLFKGCTYNCNQGEYYDQLRKKVVKCGYCAEQRSKEVRDGVLGEAEEEQENLTEALGFQVKSAPLKIIEERIIPESERSIMNSQSVDEFFKSLNLVMDCFNSDRKLPSSVVFGLPREGRFDLIAHPLLTTAYKNGLIISPVTTTGSYMRERSAVQNSAVKFEDEKEFYAKYFDSAVLVMIIPSGVSEVELLAGKSLMQERASKGLSTIFLTTSPESSIGELVGTRYGHDGTRYETEPSNYVAKGVFATYDKTKRDENRWSQVASESSEITSTTLDELRNQTKKPNSGIGFGSATNDLSKSRVTRSFG